MEIAKQSPAQGLQYAANCPPDLESPGINVPLSPSFQLELQTPDFESYSLNRILIYEPCLTQDTAPMSISKSWIPHRDDDLVACL